MVENKQVFIHLILLSTQITIFVKELVQFFLSIYVKNNKIAVLSLPITLMLLCNTS